jgi:GNAT superfamily N-acetyltransferase
MQISAITKNDIEALRELQPEGWPDIIPFFNFYTNNSFCKPLKFTKQNRIIGIGSAIIFPSSAWLGHIIVPPDYRNQGMGSIITQTLVEHAKGINCQTISLIATDLGKPVYEKLGFLTKTNYQFYKKDDLKPSNIISDLTQPATSEFFSDILALDKQAYGEERSELLLPHLENAQIYVENNLLKGFYLPTLGEGLIVAKDTNSGIELSKLMFKTRNTIVLPQENEGSIKFLKQEGFTLIKSASKMYLGENLDTEQQLIFNRSGGNVG